MRSGSAHLAGTRNHLAQPAPQPGGRLPGRVCPVGPLSIVPRILAGGCLAPPPGDDVTERRSLYVGPHEKVHSVLTASRKGAVCPRHSRRVRLSVRSCRQNALFRTARGCRMRFSVRHGLQNALFRRVRLFSPGQTSSHLTQKRILCSPPHAKVQSAPSTSRKGAFCARAVAQNAPFREVRPQAEVRDPGATPPQPGGWLLGRICPVEPFSIVPRILAGGCLAPPPGDDVTERRTLYASH